MNWPNEVVEKCAEKLVQLSGYGEDSPGYSACVIGARSEAQAALSSITLQDIAKLPEVKALVEAAYREGYKDAKGPYGIVENLQNQHWGVSKAKQALAAFTEASK